MNRIIKPSVPKELDEYCCKHCGKQFVVPLLARDHEPKCEAR